MDDQAGAARPLAPASPRAVQPARGYGPILRSTTGSEPAIFTVHGNWDLHTTWAAIVAAIGLTGVSAAADALWVLPLNFAAAYAAQSGVAAWRQRRWFGRAPRAQQLAEVDPALLVRLVGRVEAEDPEDIFKSASGRLAVHARSLFFVADRTGLPSASAREQVRGVPIRLRLADGTTVRLAPETIKLVDPPRRQRRVPIEELKIRGAARFGSALTDRPARFEEATFGPGDEIEVVGHLTRTAHPGGQALPGRGVPLVYTLTPPPDGWIWTRTRRRR